MQFAQVQLVDDFMFLMLKYMVMISVNKLNLLDMSQE